MMRERIRVDETIATVAIEGESVAAILNLVKEARAILLDYIDSNPEFESSFSPIAVEQNAPSLIREMADASKKMNVGPMASVAGAIAQFVVDGMVAAGVEHIIFDNGGDIVMSLKEPAVVGIYTGRERTSGLGFKVDRLGERLALCTSSGTVGHSFSYGVSDAAIVYARDAVLADAAATALGNRIADAQPRTVKDAMRASMREGIEGVAVMVRDTVGTLGKLPSIVRARADYSLISKAWEVR